jgi:stress-induced morphogen
MRLLMPQELTTRSERMRSALIAAFSPAELDIVDESHLHHGHAGAAPGGETHYSVKIRSAAFAGLSRLARHRAVNDALKAEFAAGLEPDPQNAKRPRVAEPSAYPGPIQKIARSRLIFAIRPRMKIGVHPRF